jgi:hypothetical protein
VKKISSFLISHFSFLIAFLAILLLPEQTYAYDFMYVKPHFIVTAIAPSRILAGSPDLKVGGESNEADRSRSFDWDDGE